MEQLKGKAESIEDRELLDEAILVPAMQGRGSVPPFIARFWHVPIAGLFGMIAGSILAWMFSVVVF